MVFATTAGDNSARHSTLVFQLGTKATGGLGLWRIGARNGVLRKLTESPDVRRAFAFSVTARGIYRLHRGRSTEVSRRPAVA